MMLNDLDIENARKLIAGKPAGEYSLREIYGKEWETIESPVSFGKKFKKSVENGSLVGVELFRKKSNNHWIYIVK